MIEEELARLASSPLSEREKDDTIAAAASKLSSLCVKIARMHARYPGLVWSRDGDDLVQLVQELALLKLRKITSDGEPGPNFEVNLSRSARGIIRDYADSGQNTMMARGGAAHRRARLEFVQREIDTMLLAPQDREADATPHFATMVFNNNAEATTQLDASAHLEMQSTIDRVIEVCARHKSPAVLAVARSMFSWFPDGSPPLVTDIAKQLGLPYSTVKRRHDDVVAIFRREYAEQADVDESD
jgi:hypothetical protein